MKFLLRPHAQALANPHTALPRRARAGFITANIDNDSGGILTYSNAGAQFGYTLLWTMIPITVALLVVQEMCARMGAVTGKGLSDLIREEFGLRMTFLLMLLLVVVNFGNVMAEFAGIAGSMQLFHISKYVSVPASAFLIWFLVVKGDYKRVEKVFLAASVFYIAYIVTGVLSQPSWHEAMVATVELPSGNIWHSKSYIYMIVGVIGTTISPWMQFYLQSSIVEKGVTAKSYPASAWTSSSGHSSPTSWPGSSWWHAPPPCLPMAWGPSGRQRTRPRR